MIRRFRYALTIVRDLSMILCPASASVRAEVVARRAADLLADDYLTEREAAVDVMEPWSFPAAGVAAGTGPGQACGVPLASPCPGQPNEPEHVAELVRYHHVTANQMDGVYCHCGHVSHNDRRHAHHVAGLVEDMIAADVRLANKFQK